MLLNTVQLNMTTQNILLHNLSTSFQDITHNIAKSVLMVAPPAIIFIEFLQIVKIANYINNVTTVIIITIMLYYIILIL